MPGSPDRRGRAPWRRDRHCARTTGCGPAAAATAPAWGRGRRAYVRSLRVLRRGGLCRRFDRPGDSGAFGRGRLVIALVVGLAVRLGLDDAEHRADRIGIATEIRRPLRQVLQLIILVGDN